MKRVIGIAPSILFASATIVLAQGSNTPSAPPAAPPPQVLGQTGTMYGGNNDNLKLPAEPNKYWVDLWAQPTGHGGPAATDATLSGRPEAGQQ
jgi:hypothetical protein